MLFFLMFFLFSDSGIELKGLVQDANSTDKLAWTYIGIKELNRWETSDEDGNFKFDHLPDGTYTLVAQRIGYSDFSKQIKIVGNNLSFTINLVKSTIESEIVDVIGQKEKKIFEKPLINISDKKLRQQLSTTIAETISHESGISLRSMGPAPARPVMRGLSGDRLLLTEDGERTGDLSATSSDHAVVIEPLNAKRIEIIRGAESLTYGSNTIGGIINVVREYIPTEHQKNIDASIGLNSESVNKSSAFGLSLKIPIDTLVNTKFDFSYRNAKNMQTPISELENTSLETYNASFGLSQNYQWGLLGMAGGYYSSIYGIPPDDKGHIYGVDIDLFRINLEAKAQIWINNTVLKNIDLNYRFTNYFHKELEIDKNVRSLGMDFGVLTKNIDAKFFITENTIFKNAKIGLWTEIREFASSFGLAADTKEITNAIFFYNEYTLGPFLANNSIRFDHKNITPNQDIFDADVGNIEKKQFDGFSTAFTVIYPVTNFTKMSYNFIKTFRSPTLEELFSRGPHLASYGYEIGNSNLSAETAMGHEIRFEFDDSHQEFTLTLFANLFKNYLYLNKTDVQAPSRNDLQIYKYLNNDANMLGIESAFDLHLAEELDLGGHFSYVEGKIINAAINGYLPQIPPLQYSFHLDYKWDEMELSFVGRGADAQLKLGENEKYTGSYLVYDLNYNYSFIYADFLSTFNFSINNLFNKVYHQHLNQIKDIMPEAGLNVKAMLKVFF